jgi:hypothetical protein
LNHFTVPLAIIALHVEEHDIESVRTCIVDSFAWA